MLQSVKFNELANHYGNYQIKFAWVGTNDHVNEWNAQCML